MTDMKRFEEAQARFDDRKQRLTWTGAAANGALLLASLAHMSTTGDIRAGTPQLLLSLTGFALGGGAITWGLAALALRPSEAVQRIRAEFAQSRLEMFKAVLREPPMHPEVARLTYGEDADEKSKELLRELLAKAQLAWDESPKEASTAFEELSRLAKIGAGRDLLSRRLLVISFALAGAAVFATVVKAWFI
jgi:hypothetical protein